MPESKADTVKRLRRQADSAERQGENLLNVSMLFAGSGNYDQVVMDGNSLIAEAKALRQQANRLEAEEFPVDSN